MQEGWSQAEGSNSWQEEEDAPECPHETKGAHKLGSILCCLTGDGLIDDACGKEQEKCIDKMGKESPASIAIGHE